MSKAPKIIPISDLRQNASDVVRQLSSSREHSQHEREILRLLALGEKEIEAGTGYDLNDVMKEADKLLEGP
jgi:hypothetical protein